MRVALYGRRCRTCTCQMDALLAGLGVFTTAVRRQLRCFSDCFFWLAMLAGPLVWMSAMLLPGSATWVHQILSGESSAVMQLAALLSNWIALVVRHAEVLFFVVLLYPVLEEIVFRGGLQSWLLEKSAWQRRLGGISLANMFTTVLFAAMHLINHPVNAAAMVIIPSLVFGWARERFNGLVAPIALHMFYNAGYFTLLSELR